MARFADRVDHFLRGHGVDSKDSDDWFEDELADARSGMLHWSIICRDLNRFAAVHLESEFSDWVEIDFPPGSGPSEVRKALHSAAEHSDGWSPINPLEKWDPDRRFDKYRDYFEVSKKNPSNSAPIIVRLRLQSETPDPVAVPGQSLHLWLRADPDTVVPEDLDEAIGYFRRFYKRYNELFQRLLRRSASASVGQSSTLHDFSKDLNALDIQMERYQRFLADERTKFGSLIERLEKLPAQEPGTNETHKKISLGLRAILDQYGLPALDLQMLTRFQMMHMKAENARSLYEQPQFCVERLNRGSKADIARVVNFLVWMRSHEWVDPARTWEQGQDFDAWGRIFVYENRDNPANVHVIELARHLFSDLGVQIEELGECFPRPLLRCIRHTGQEAVEVGPDEPFLWPEHNGHPVRPSVYGFLPLFVFSLRAAYLHTYVATLETGKNARSKSELSRRLPDGRHPNQRYITLQPSFIRGEQGSISNYQLAIRFPATLMASRTLLPSLPLGDWSGHMETYSPLVSLWRPSLSLERGKGDIGESEFVITLSSR